MELVGKLLALSALFIMLSVILDKYIDIWVNNDDS